MGSGRDKTSVIGRLTAGSTAKFVFLQLMLRYLVQTSVIGHKVNIIG